MPGRHIGHLHSDHCHAGRRHARIILRFPQSLEVKVNINYVQENKQQVVYIFTDWQLTTKLQPKI